MIKFKRKYLIPDLKSSEILTDLFQTWEKGNIIYWDIELMERISAKEAKYKINYSGIDNLFYVNLKLQNNELIVYFIAPIIGFVLPIILTLALFYFLFKSMFSQLFFFLVLLVWFRQIFMLFRVWTTLNKVIEEKVSGLKTKEKQDVRQDLPPKH